MKIGLVRRGYSRTGGAEAYLQRFAKSAVAAGHEVILLTEQWPRDAWLFEYLRVVSNSPRTFADGLVKLRAREACDFLFSLERVWSCHGYRAGDGVHAEWLERRAQFEPFWKPLFRRFSLKHQEILAIEKRLFSAKGAEVVIANSRMVQAEITRRFGYPSDRVHIVYNGVPPFTAPPDSRAQVRSELGYREEDYVLLFAGSGWERKGLRFAIKAMNALPHGRARLVVAGRGAARGLPSSRRVRFIGARPDLPRFLAAADAFILPTLYEPFSNACLEALAAGLPVITTRQNGFAEIIESGKDGEVIDDPRDTSALVWAIEAWRDPQRRADRRPHLAELGARYSIDANVRQTLAIITH